MDVSRPPRMEPAFMHLAPDAHRDVARGFKPWTAGREPSVALRRTRAGTPAGVSATLWKQEPVLRLLFLLLGCSGEQKNTGFAGLAGMDDRPAPWTARSGQLQGRRRGLDPPAVAIKTGKGHRFSFLVNPNKKTGLFLFSGGLANINNKLQTKTENKLPFHPPTQ